MTVQEAAQKALDIITQNVETICQCADVLRESRYENVPKNNADPIWAYITLWEVEGYMRDAIGDLKILAANGVEDETD